MKAFFIVSLLVIINLSSQAQGLRNMPSRITADAVYQKGKVYVNAGVGFPNLFFKVSELTGILSNLYTTQKKGFLTMHATGEYALQQNLGVGLLLGYAEGQYRYTSTTNSNNYYGFKGSFLNIGVLSNYHILSNKTIDVYTGAMLVYNSKKVSPIKNGTISTVENFLFQQITQPDVPELLYQVSVGLRVFPFKTKTIGFFAEGGYGVTLVKAGIAIK
jgi:hypothetical protein